MNVLGDRVLELGPKPDADRPYKNFKLTRDADGVAWLLFDREGTSANTLSADLIKELDKSSPNLKASGPRESSFAPPRNPASSPEPTSTNSAAPAIRARSSSRSAARMP